jgi:hypothetical protein
MTEPTAFTSETFESLLTKLDTLALTAGERAVLRAVLTVAQDVTEVSLVEDGAAASDSVGEPSFRADFAEAFTTSKAGLIEAYVAAPGMVGRSLPHWMATHATVLMVGQSTGPGTAVPGHPPGGSG